MLIDTYFSALAKEKEIVKNSLFIFLTGLVSATLSTSSNIIFSRFFGPAGFGVFKTAISLASTVAYILDLGAKYLIPRYIAEFEHKKKPENISHLIERTLMLKAIITVFVLISAWFLSHQIAGTFFHSEALTILVLPTMLLFTIIFLDITIPILLGYQHFKLLALTSILVPFFHILVGLPLAFIFGIKGALFGTAIAFVTGSIPAIRFILKKIGTRSKIRSFSFKSALVSYGIPAYLANIPTYISIAIIPLLSVFFTQRQVGFYSLSLSFYTAALLIPVTLANVMFPKVAELHSREKVKEAQETFVRLTLIYTPFAILGSILIIPVAEPLVRLLVPSFLPASKIIIIQTITALFFGYFAIGVNYATAAGKMRVATILNWFLSLIFLILAFYLTGSTK